MGQTTGAVRGALIASSLVQSRFVHKELSCLRWW